MNQINIFRTALMFYTRIPVGNIKNYNNKMLSKSTRYFPFIGFIIGSLTALVFWLFSLILPINLAIALSMAFSVYLTGSFHEDGFADFCDGFGGGYTKERILTIMKDSRIGTYGTVGLIFMLATKYLSLAHIQTKWLVIAIIAGHTISRLLPVVLIQLTNYVREDALSKSKPIGERDSLVGFIFALLSGLAPLLYLKLEFTIAYVLLMIPVLIIFMRYIKRKIGGYTGDVMGAFQQLCEVSFYLTFVAIYQSSWSLF